MAGEWRATVYGDFAADFIVERLANLCDRNDGVQTGPFGSQLHQEDYVAVGTPIITVEHLGENRVVHRDIPRVSDADKQRLSKYALRKGDIVFSRVGSVDRRALVRDTEEGWLFSGRCLRVRPDPSKIDPSYLSYFFGLPSFKEHIRAIAVGATMPSLNTDILSDVSVLHPRDLSEQRAIAHILATLDDQTELNRRMNETLEAMARAIFKSWFVDFDPVRAKAEGRHAFGMDAETAALFPDSLQDSALGKIPKGWRVAKLSELCTTQYGYTASATDEPVGPKFLRVTDINKKNWIEWNSVPHCQVPNDSKSKYSLVVGDIVVARMADPGKSAIIEEEVDAVFASYLVRLKTESLATAYYVYGFLKSQAYEEYSQGTVSGSVQANMNARVIVGADLVIPSSKLIDGYAAQVLPLRRRIVSNLREASTLTAIRDALLPKLISGQIRVRDAEKLLGSSGT